jgi:hypothetical protein
LLELIEEARLVMGTLEFGSLAFGFLVLVKGIHLELFFTLTDQEVTDFLKGSL